MNVLHQITVPQESVNDQRLIVVGILFKNGDAVRAKDVVLELETSKAVVTVEAGADGFVSYSCGLGDEVEVNGVIARITSEPVAAADGRVFAGNTGALAAATPASGPRSYEGPIETQFSEKAERLIASHRLDKALFAHFDFVTEDTVLNHLEPGRERPAAMNGHVPANGRARTFGAPEASDKFSVRKIGVTKKREIEYLSDVQSAGLVSVIHVDVDLDGLFESVRPYMRYFQDSLLPLVAYESSRLLVKYPVLNGFYVEGHIATYHEVQVGVAMDMDDGLKVVRVKDTLKRTLPEIDEELFRLAGKYMDKKLEKEDLTDVTFTITDLSAQGALFFSPLINKGNSAILGISKVDSKLQRAILTLAFDHRVSDGKTAATFLSDLKERLESYTFGGREAKAKAAAQSRADEIVCHRCLKKLKEDLNGVGFVKVVNARGEDKYICDSCLFNY